MIYGFSRKKKSKDIFGQKKKGGIGIKEINNDYHVF